MAKTTVEAVQGAGGALQPVITGDLMDSPNGSSHAEFAAFRNRLTDLCGTRVVIIPGNHDMKKKGFLWRKVGRLADLEWSNVVESDVCKVTFACFDSSREAVLARGKITDDQFRTIATALQEIRRLRGTDDRMTIALTHHHPFSSQEDEVDTLPLLGIREERFLRMENGEKLVEWCAKMGVPVILHGHKHKPRYIGQEVVLHDKSETRLVRAIGCGTSLGAEGKPLSYNWIAWRPDQRRWTVSFFADPGDGSGFVERRVASGSA